MPSQIEIIEEALFLPGAAGQLEAVLTYPESGNSVPNVLIAGPHPLLGGDFENNVVQQLSNLLAMCQMTTLRFNYRGVGLSEGEKVISTDNISQFLATSHIDEEENFGEDVASAGNYLQQHFGKIDCVIGYSFGAYLASKWADNNENVKSIVMISPTIEKHDYNPFMNLNIPKLVISSLDDFAVPLDDLNKLFSECKEPKKLIIENIDNHFFRGYENWLAKAIQEFLGDIP